MTYDQPGGLFIKKPKADKSEAALREEVREAHVTLNALGAPRDSTLSRRIARLATILRFGAE